MSKINKTYLQLQIFDAVASNWLNKNGFLADKKYTEKINTDFSSALKSVLKQCATHFTALNEELEDLRLLNCAVDPNTKVQLKNAAGQRQYTIEGEQKLKKEIKEFFATEVTVHQRIVLEPPTDLSEEELEVFSELVIPKQDAVND